MDTGLKLALSDTQTQVFSRRGTYDLTYIGESFQDFEADFPKKVGLRILN